MSNHAKTNLVKDIIQDPSFQQYYQYIKKAESEHFDKVRPLRVELKQVIGSLLSFLIAGIHLKSPLSMSVKMMRKCESLRVTYLN